MWTRYGGHARNLLLIWLVYVPLILSALMIPRIYVGLIYLSNMLDQTSASVALLIAMLILLIALAARARDRARKMQENSASYAVVRVYEPLLLFAGSGAVLCTTMSVLLDTALLTLLGGAAAVGAALSAVSAIATLTKTRIEDAETGLYQRFGASILAGAFGGIVFGGLFREIGFFSMRVVLPPKPWRLPVSR